MNTTINEVLTFVKENDVKFIRLSFCDIFGQQKNMSIMASELESAFKRGVSFDANSIKGFSDVTNSDLFLFPDPATLSVLPWRPGPGRVLRMYCDVRNPDGGQFPNDSRAILKAVLARGEKMGYTCNVGAECEFYLFKQDDKGKPTQEPLDNGGYLDIAPLDKGEDIRRDICLALEEMNIQPETSHHEQGQGQNEIDFKYNDALESADNLQTFKWAVRAIAARNGLFASFMPKPIANAAGSGLHINISIAQNGKNLFKSTRDGHSAEAENFIAGVLAKAADMTVFLNPIINSYDRFGKFEAPKYVSWSHNNRSQLVRIPAATGERVRMELRSPDPAVNPYLAFALIISAGLDGIEKKLPLPPTADIDLFDDNKAETQPLKTIPSDLEQAVLLAQNSTFVADVVGAGFLEKYLSAKQKELRDFAAAPDAETFYKERYFPTI